MQSILSRSVSLLTLSLLLSPLSDFQANARWMEEDEANVECLNKTTHYKVNQDGTWTMESEMQLKVLTETGRQGLSTLTYAYDATHFALEILEAKINNNGIEAVVPLRKIEDKPLASDSLGLRDTHQILIPFERMSIGSIVYLKLKQQLFKPQTKNYFAKSITFCDGYLWRNNTTTIESELPLFSKINDPRNCLEVSESTDESKHTFQITLKKPVLEQLTGEFFTHAEPDLYTSISFSTDKDYERIGRLIAKPFQAVITASFPKDLEKILSIASTITDEIECIDTIVTHLIEKITYLQSRNTAEGFLEPRSLEDIITSGYGDCKEYAACLTAILNQLGYTAKCALVNRDEIYLEEEAPLPKPSAFDHVIVKVIGPSGKIYWVDPTNNVTMVDGIFPDNADRPVLVLDPEIPIYERTPPISPQHALFNFEEILTIGNEGYVHREGSFSHEGEAAQSLTEKLILQPHSLVKEEFVKLMSQNSHPINPILNFSESPSRTVKPLRGTFSYEEDHVMTRTNYGSAFPLRNNWSWPYISVSKKDEGALYVGHPQTSIKKQIFKNVSAKKLDALAFSIETPWLNAKRELVPTEEGIVVTETVEQLTSIISAKDLKSEKYGELKQTLRQYCSGVTIIFSK